VGSHGYDFSRFREALDSGNVAEALTAASALPHVGIVEALELVLLLCDREPEKFGRGRALDVRYCHETKAELEEVQAVLACLSALRGPRREAAAAALSDLIYRRGLERASEAVNRWASDCRQRTRDQS
jgi:hypothetical protein